MIYLGVDTLCWHLRLDQLGLPQQLGAVETRNDTQDRALESDGPLEPGVDPGDAQVRRVSVSALSEKVSRRQET